MIFSDLRSSNPYASSWTFLSPLGHPLPFPVPLFAISPRQASVAYSDADPAIRRSNEGNPSTSGTNLVRKYVNTTLSRADSSLGEFCYEQTYPLLRMGSETPALWHFQGAKMQTVLLNRLSLALSIQMVPP